MIENSPLVSIGVVTYNSGEFIFETLESVKSQTYKNIELVISDDCSQDDTVEICKDWLSKNGKLFVHAELVTSPHNTGVSANSNRAFNKTHGEWYKLLDGDDMLMPNAIEDFVSFVQNNPKVNLVFSPAIHFVESFNAENPGDPDVISRYIYQENKTAKDQAKVISKIFIGSGPTCFVKRDAVVAIGGFDERFPLIEDYPLLINLVCSGNKLHLMNSPTVFKRIRSSSIQYAKDNNSILSNSTVRCVKEYKYLFKREHLTGIWRRLLSYSLWIMNHIIDSGNKYSIPAAVRWNRVYRYTDPFLIYQKVFRIKCLYYDKSKRR